MLHAEHLTSDRAQKRRLHGQRPGSAPHGLNYTSDATKRLEKMMNEMHKTDALVFQNDAASEHKDANLLALSFNATSTILPSLSRCY